MENTPQLYRLVVRGYLAEHAPEKVILVLLNRIGAKRSEDYLRSLESSEAFELVRSDDRETVDQYAQALTRAGLDVRVETSASAFRQPTPTIKPLAGDGRPAGKQVRAGNDPSADASVRRHPVRRLVLAGIVGTLLLFFGLAGYLFYWFNNSGGAAVTAAEDALASEDLIALAHADVSRLRFLDQYLFGAFDPESLPFDTEQQRFLNKLVHGPADLYHRADQLLFALYNSDPKEATNRVVVLHGEFDQQSFVDTLKPDHEIETVQGGFLKVVAKPASSDRFVCPGDRQQSRPLFLKVSEQWAVLSDSNWQNARLWERLQKSAQPQQDMTRWRDYRSDRLASLMVLRPGTSAGQIGAVNGMLLNTASAGSAQLEALAMGLNAGVMPVALKVNARVYSPAGDRWISETGNRIQKMLDDAHDGIQHLSSSVADTVRGTRISAGADRLDIDISLDKTLLKTPEQLVQGIFGIATGPDQPAEVPTEIINDSPTDHMNTSNLAVVPFVKGEHDIVPLFSGGPFGVDLGSISKNDDGLFELDVLGKLQLAGLADGTLLEGPMLSIAVSSVTDRDGNELLRDERCLDDVSFWGRNHEPETQNSLFVSNGQVGVRKSVRLRAGSSAEAIDRISGTVSFGWPAQVTRIVLDIGAGQQVEHNGLSFHLGDVSNGRVRYQLSGQTDNLLEVRALNARNQVLRQEWSMSDGFTGRVTQSFHGVVEGLELYIADQFANREVSFALTDLLREVPSDRGGLAPIAAPEKVDTAIWQRASRLDLDALAVDPSDWNLWGEERNTAIIGRLDRAPVRLLVTHRLASWAYEPKAHLYFPVVPELQGVLGALSYRIDEPAQQNQTEHPVMVHYPRLNSTGEVSVERQLEGIPFALLNFPLSVSLEPEEKLQRLTGELVFRLPTETDRHELAVAALWESIEIGGMEVSLESMEHGMFAGYKLRLRGDLSALVNLYGLTADGQRVPASPMNFQSDGSLTATLPFTTGMTAVELITATQQQTFAYPFDLQPDYANKLQP